MTAKALWVALLALFSGVGASPNLPQCSDSAYCEFYKPEDISLVPGTDWIIVAQDVVSAPLQLLNTGDPGRRFGQIPAGPLGSGELDCGDPPERIRPRGHSVGTLNGREYFAVINTVDSARIELFQIVLDTPEPGLLWQGCILVPDHLMLNDIVFGPNDSLYASHMFQRPESTQDAAALQEAFLERANTGYAVRWRVADGWSKVPGTDVSFANGIAVSGDGTTLAVAGTYSEAVILVNLLSRTRKVLRLPLQPDNITSLVGEEFLVVGHTGSPITGIDPCRPVEAFPCGFPFAVIRFDLTAPPVTVFEHNGTSIPGASVAVTLQDGSLLLGSAFGDRLVSVASEVR